MNNRLRNPMKIVIEGEEESGSLGISAVLPSYREKLKADILLVCDTNARSPHQPAITMGLRGNIALEVTLEGAKRDLHSGQHGGVAPNPALEMAQLITSLHNQDGSIAVKGYYDDVLLPSSHDLELANNAPIDPALYQEEFGVPPAGGEKGFTPVERKGFRPTIEVNGLYSGYTGPGGKTIIPSFATVKLSSRLVPRQNPEVCRRLLVDHLQERAPQGLKLHLSSQGEGGEALMLSSSSPLAQRAHSVLNDLFGERVAFVWSGGSIRVVTELALATGATPLLVGFGLESDAIHAPNESFSLEQFMKGYLFVASFLVSLNG